LTKVWIHEISPSRTEIRILPLKTKNDNINNITNKEFKNVNNLNKDFKYYKKNILDSLDGIENTYLTSIANAMTNRFGKDFESILRKDFGLSDFNGFKKRVFSDFKTSINYWVNNKEYDISQSNYGKNSIIRFEDCEQYDFQFLLNEIPNILRNCIDYHTKTLKRRDITIKSLPKEFEITTIKKQTQDLVGSISVKEEKIRNVYNPKNVNLNVKGVGGYNPPKDIIVPIELPPAPIKKEEPKPIQPIKEEPIQIIEPMPEPIPKQDIIPTPYIGGGGGGRSFYEPVNYDGGLYGNDGRNIIPKLRGEEYT